MQKKYYLNIYLIYIQIINESTFFYVICRISINNIKNGTNLPSRQSLDFALAEFSSAIEMLQAAKLVETLDFSYFKTLVDIGGVPFMQSLVIKL